MDYDDDVIHSHDNTLEQRRRRSELNNSTLYDLAARNIWINRALFCNQFGRTGINQLACLPNSLRADLISRNRFTLRENEASGNCQFLDQLLNSEVTKVTFADLQMAPSSVMKSVSDTCFAITQKCPALKKLLCDNFFMPDRLGDFFSFALNLKHLQMLTIPNLQCDDLRLQLFAQCLPQLRSLDVSLIVNFVSAKGIAALANLEHLQEFLYKETLNTNSSTNQKLFSLCLKFLPRLRISCRTLEISLEIKPQHLSYIWDAFRGLQDKLPKRLELRHLALFRTSKMPVGVALPELRTLILFKPLENFQFGSSNSVTELGLHDLNQESFEKILFKIGHQLLKLSVWVSDTLMLDRVFRMCPDLQVLFISRFPSEFIGLEAPLRPCSLSCLSEFGFAVQKPNRYYRLSRFQPGHLLQILRAASQLRVLRLKFFEHDERLDGAICEALEQHSVLQNLQRLFFFFRPEVESDEEEFGQSRLQDEVLMTSSHALLCAIIENCPKLFYVKSN